ncbi:MAG: magnesium/cobalt transporter CorA [Planctomycetota bacterium]
MKRKKYRPARVGRKLGHALDHTVAHAADTVSKTAATVGHALTSTLRLSGLTHRNREDLHQKPATPGAAPGIEGFADRHTPPPPGTIQITVHDIGPDTLETYEREDLTALLQETPVDPIHTRWINIDGLHPWVVQQFVDHLGFHTLAAEDTLHVPQRPKAESYDDHLFAVARMMRLADDQLTAEQVSFFLKGRLLVTFQENTSEHHRGDVWDPVRARLKVADSRIRLRGPDYLLYALIDAVIDHCFPVLERFGDILEDLEPRVIENPSPQLIAHIYGVKRELALLRRVLWPTRELVNHLMAETTAEITPETKLFLRDAQEHCVQLVEIIETFRDMTASLTDLHMSAVGNRMNEVMKFLTIMGTIFIPITFLAGIYGMNFEHIPELKHRYAYPIFWIACGTITLGLLAWFYRKGWIGSRG